MKKLTFALAFLLLSLLISCSSGTFKYDSSSNYVGIVNSTDTSNLASTESSKKTKTYRVYEENPDIINEFDSAMLNNPIDKKMYLQLETLDKASTYDFVEFYGNYIGEWEAELIFSIENLQKHLTPKEITDFNAAEELWENCLKSNNDFDIEYMKSNSIYLGTQFASTSLIYIIDQYRDRVFHLKYMTYLAEGLEDSKTPDGGVTWNRFSIMSQ